MVLDTNVLASGFVRANPTSPPVQIVNAWRAGIYRLALSDYILTELVRTFGGHVSQRIADKKRINGCVADILS
ncbi:MAG TPA: PIN domain-containing protein [Dehalococcoidia bacterium]|nr:PIN domain-containing protein [Dehalococcoidia bacterium]HLE79763.1 PIN domain-containing protein [Dehalococcoidia bacterium]